MSATAGAGPTAAEADFEPLYALLYRFCSGANRSERLAREIVSWVRAHAPAEPRLGELAAGLARYRSKEGRSDVGQQEAARLCRSAMEAIHPPEPPPACPACGSDLAEYGQVIVGAPPGAPRRAICYRQYECSRCGARCQRTDRDAPWEPW